MIFYINNHTEIAINMEIAAYVRGKTTIFQASDSVMDSVPAQSPKVCEFDSQLGWKFYVSFFFYDNVFAIH